jgi:hypothetical protein
MLNLWTVVPGRLPAAIAAGFFVCRSNRVTMKNTLQ